MTNRPVEATRRQRDIAHGMADDFQTTPLHNAVHDALSDDTELVRLCDAVAEAAAASEHRERVHGEDGAFKDLNEAWGILAHVVRQRALEVVADTCVTIIHNGDQWADDDPWNTEEVHDAIQEAREWAQSHTNAVSRIGRMGEVSDQ